MRNLQYRYESGKFWLCVHHKLIKRMDTICAENVKLFKDNKPLLDCRQLDDLINKVYNHYMNNTWSYKDE